MAILEVCAVSPATKSHGMDRYCSLGYRREVFSRTFCVTNPGLRAPKGAFFARFVCVTLLFTAAP